MARKIANSLQVGESTVRTNLRGIYVGGGSMVSSASPMLVSDDAQDILDMCPPPEGFEVNARGGGGAGGGGDVGGEWDGGKCKVLRAVGVDSMAGLAPCGDEPYSEGAGAWYALSRSVLPLVCAWHVPARARWRACSVFARWRFCSAQN